VPKVFFISLLGGADAFRIYVKPQNVTSDITTKIITSSIPVDNYNGAVIPLPSRNSLLKLDVDSAANVAANITPGLQVTVTT
jgi:hypothetical protein